MIVRGANGENVIHAEGATETEALQRAFEQADSLGMMVCQGVILHAGEYLFVSNSEALGFDESRKRLLSALRLKEAEVFPLSFRLGVAVAGRAKYSGGELP